MECIQEAIARTVIGKLAGIHCSACYPTVVLASRVRHNLICRIFVPQPYDSVINRVRSQVQRGSASLHIAAIKSIPIAAGNVDTVCSGNRASA